MTQSIIPRSIDFSPLTPTDFESLTYDLLEAEGFKNLQWRDGGADGGRDIEAISKDEDRSGHEFDTTWHCDAKLYSQGIPFDKIQPSLARATANGPDYLLLAVHPYLTPQCKDMLLSWKIENRPRYQVRVWERKDIETRLLATPSILRKHLPASWSHEVEMQSYLAEAISVLRAFRSRVRPVWKTTEQQPYSDLIRLTPKIADAPFVKQIDLSNILSESELLFLQSLLSSALHMQKLLTAVFNLPNNEVFLWIAQWHDHQDDCIVIPTYLKMITDGERRTRIGHLLKLLLDKYETFSQNGIAALALDYPPYDSSSRERIYAVRGVYSTAGLGSSEPDT